MVHGRVDRKRREDGVKASNDDDGDGDGDGDGGRRASEAPGRLASVLRPASCVLRQGRPGPRNSDRGSPWANGSGGEEIAHARALPRLSPTPSTPPTLLYPPLALSRPPTTLYTHTPLLSRLPLRSLLHSVQTLLDLVVPRSSLFPVFLNTLRLGLDNSRFATHSTPPASFQSHQTPLDSRPLDCCTWRSVASEFTLPTPGCQLDCHSKLPSSALTPSQRRNCSIPRRRMPRRSSSMLCFL